MQQKVMIRTRVFIHGYQRGRTQAESLLARIECLPPLNFSGERFFEVSNRLTGNSPLPCPKVIFKDYFKNEKLGGTTCLLNSSLFQGRVFLFF
jgi:hypothetical protein